MALISSAQQSLTDRLGADLTMPINGNFVPVSGVDLLLQDMQVLLMTVPGEHVFRPSFGCNLVNQIWGNIDDVASKGPATITAALNKFEPRINTLSVTSTVNRNTGLVIFNINFIILATSTPFNLVFPLRIGSQLSFS